MKTTTHRSLLILSLAFATAIKLVLAWFTIGTNDVATWRAFADNAALCDSCVYNIPGPFGDPFNHPPFIIHFLRLIANAPLYAFPFWLRLPSIIADIGSVWLATKMLPKAPVYALVLLALNPVSILVSGFHGNTDAVMIFFLLLAVYLVKAGRSGWAAAAFGMALNIKVVPLLVFPAVFFYLKTWRRRTAFISIAAAVVLGFSVPYVFSDPLGIAKATLGYTGLFGKWGTSRLIIALPISKPSMYFAGAVLRVLIVGLSLGVAFWMNRRKVDLFTQVGVILFLFFFLSPAVGVQYLAWPVVFVLSAGSWWSSAYYVSAGLYLLLTYNYWSNGRWYYADSHIEPQWSVGSYMAGFLCWAICGFICLRYKQLLHTSYSRQPASDARNVVDSVT